MSGSLEFETDKKDLYKPCRKGRRASSKTMIAAVKSKDVNSLECLKFLISIGIIPNIDVMNAAAETDKLECLIFLCEQGCDYDSSTVDIAVAAGSLRCLKYLIRIIDVNLGF